MDVNDPALPAPANDWLLIGADQFRAWGIALQESVEVDVVGELAQTMLSVIEAQARIIGDLAARIDALESR